MRACVRANERTNENVVRSPGGRLLSTTAPIYRQGAGTTTTTTMIMAHGLALI